MTQPAPAVALYVPTYAARSPYLTQAEFLAAPTGVDLTQLMPGGTEPQNAAALNTVLSAASSYADTLCYQVLAATIDTVAGEYRVFPDGTIRVPVEFTPLIAVNAVNIGWQANSLQPLTDLSGLWLSRKVVRIPVVGSPGWAVLNAPLPAPVQPRSGCVFAAVTYVNGYTNTTLAASAIAGATSVTVTDATGIFPGLPMTILDDQTPSTEHVTVAASYTVGSTTVPLAAATVNAHTAGTAISALPRAIKQAVICLAVHLIKTRGAESIALDSVGGAPGKLNEESAGYTEEFEQAQDLLAPFRRAR